MISFEHLNNTRQLGPRGLIAFPGTLTSFKSIFFIFRRNLEFWIFPQKKLITFSTGRYGLLINVPCSTTEAVIGPKNDLNIPRNTSGTIFCWRWNFLDYPSGREKLPRESTLGLPCGRWRWSSGWPATSAAISSPGKRRSWSRAHSPGSPGSLGSNKTNARI